MQTFLPYSDYKKSAASLDRMRLGKQRVETFQVLQRLLGVRLVSKDANGEPIPEEDWSVTPITSTGWINHPAVKAWRGHELELLEYQRAFCNEWTSRGYKDTCLIKSEKLIELCGQKLNSGKPEWTLDDKVHISHKSNLLRKDPEFYGKLWSNIPDDLPYVWVE